MPTKDIKSHTLSWTKREAENSSKRERERESWKGNFLDVTTWFESRSTARKSRFKERENKSRSRKETPLLFDKSKVLTKIIKLHKWIQAGWMDKKYYYVFLNKTRTWERVSLLYVEF